MIITKCRSCGRFAEKSEELFGAVWKWTACNTTTKVIAGRPPPTSCPVCAKIEGGAAATIAALKGPTPAPRAAMCCDTCSAPAPDNARAGGTHYEMKEHAAGIPGRGRTVSRSCGKWVSK